MSASPARLPDAPRVPAIEFDLGGVPLRIAPVLLAQLLYQANAAGAAGHKLSKKERAMQVALRGFFTLALDIADGEISKGRLTGIERPVCPKGMDFLQFAYGYFARLAGVVLANTRFVLDYEVDEDGAINLLDVAPAPAGPPAARASAPATAAASADTVVGAGGDDEPGADTGAAADRSIAVGSLVRAGGDGQRQDEVRQEAARPTPRLVPVCEPVHP